MKDVTWMQVRDSEFSAARPEEAEMVPRLLDRQWLEKGPHWFFNVMVDIDQTLTFASKSMLKPRINLKSMF
jgi:hypothetical protein